MTEQQERLVLDYENMVHKWIHDHNIHLDNLGYSAEDIHQEGLLALCKAAQSYKSDKGVSFAAFAKTVLRNHISDLIRKNERRIEMVLTDFEAQAEVGPPKKKSAFDHEGMGYVS